MQVVCEVVAKKLVNYLSRLLLFSAVTYYEINLTEIFPKLIKFGVVRLLK